MTNVTLDDGLMDNSFLSTLLYITKFLYYVYDQEKAGSIYFLKI